MSSSHSRSGFTLTETLIATAIATIVTAAIASTFLFCHRMFRQTMAEAEASLAMREIRDKLLFHAGPGLDTGLLTGRASFDSASITMDWTTLDDDADAIKPNKIRLIWNSTSDYLGNFFNERVAHTDYNQRWFRPNGFRSPLTWAQTVDLPRINIRLHNDVSSAPLASTSILLPLPQ